MDTAHPPNLPELALLMTGSGLRQVFGGRVNGLATPDGAPRLLQYIPLKRAVLVWDNPDAEPRLFAKLFAETTARDVVGNYYAIHDAAERGELNFAVPQPLSYNSSFHCLLISAVPGISFTQSISGPALTPFAELGCSLAQLYTCTVNPARQWTPERELNDLVRHIVGVKRALPELTKRLNSVIGRLIALTERLDFIDKALVHGNLFGEQIRCHQGRIGIVDWDDLSWGDPLYDLGRLIAHVVHVAPARPSLQTIYVIAVRPCCAPMHTRRDASSIGGAWLGTWL